MLQIDFVWQKHEFYSLKTRIFKYFEKDKKHPSGFLIIVYLSQDDPKTKKRKKILLGANPFRAGYSDSYSDAGSKNFIKRFKIFFFVRPNFMPNDDDMLGSKLILPFQGREIGI